MPAVTPEQQRLMAQAYALKKGDITLDDIDPEYRDKIKSVADGMTLQQLKDFASTKHSEMKGKKKHVEEYAYFWWDTQADQAAKLSAGISRDKDDPLVQSFMDFIVGKRSKAVKEDFAAPAASVANTPGMGNVTPAAPGKIGSGDTFNASSKKRKKKRIDGYEDWKKMSK